MDALTFDLATVIKIVGWVVAIVGFAVAIKFGVNGLREDVKSMKKILEERTTSDGVQDNRLIKLETEADERRGWIRRIEETSAKEIAEIKETLRDLAKIVERRLTPRD